MDHLAEYEEPGFEYVVGLNGNLAEYGYFCEVLFEGDRRLASILASLVFELDSYLKNYFDLEIDDPVAINSAIASGLACGLHVGYKYALAFENSARAQGYDGHLPQTALTRLPLDQASEAIYESIADTASQALDFIYSLYDFDIYIDELLEDFNDDLRFLEDEDALYYRFLVTQSSEVVYEDEFLLAYRVGESLFAPLVAESVAQTYGHITANRSQDNCYYFWLNYPTLALDEKISSQN